MRRSHYIPAQQLAQDPVRSKVRLVDRISGRILGMEVNVLDRATLADTGAPNHWFLQ